MNIVYKKSFLNVLNCRLQGFYSLTKSYKYFKKGFYSHGMTSRELIDVYSILMLTYPGEDIRALSNALYSKKNELQKIIGEMPSFQRIPSGVYCIDLANYMGRLHITVGEGKPREAILKEQISKEMQSNPKVSELCKILRFNPEKLNS